jgi:hypothetical protein
MTGQITSLQGTEFIAHVLNHSGALNLHAQLNIDTQTNAVTGSVDASRAVGQ